MSDQLERIEKDLDDALNIGTTNAEWLVSEVKGLRSKIVALEKAGDELARELDGEFDAENFRCTAWYKLRERVGGS